jgi:hypothetical protein
MWRAEGLSALRCRAENASRALEERERERGRDREGREGGIARLRL